MSCSIFFYVAITKQNVKAFQSIYMYAKYATFGWKFTVWNTAFEVTAPIALQLYKAKARWKYLNTIVTISIFSLSKIWFEILIFFHWKILLHSTCVKTITDYAHWRYKSLKANVHNFHWNIFLNIISSIKVELVRFQNNVWYKNNPTKSNTLQFSSLSFFDTVYVAIDI